MCARLTSTATRELLELLFGVFLTEEYTPRYNAAPSQRLPIIRQPAAKREAAFLKWGLVPTWATPNTAASVGLVNAKAETLMEKPSFRDAYIHRRCLVPADGFIEWATIAGKKQPYWFRLSNEQPFAFAGIWEPTPTGATFAIITTTANNRLGEFHDRMPVILAPEHYDRWLSHTTPMHALPPLLTPYPSSEMTHQPIHPEVNNSHHDHATILRPIVATLFD